MVTIKDMLDSGVHFGHQTQRWNPKMKPYVFDSRGGIHIIDLQKTLELTKAALKAVEEQAAKGKKIIFVGTKKQAVEAIQEAANQCGQYYVTKRWLGGTLTNFVTIKQSIDRLKKIDQMREKGELQFFSKKERSQIEKEYGKLNEYLEGIREMKEPPGMIFVVDVTKEHIAVKEAQKLGMSVFGICDTNADPEIIEYPIPGNDDAIRSIKLFCGLVADAYMKGAKKWEEVLRTQTDKESDLEKEMTEQKAKKTEAAAPATDGPTVVKVNKGRKLVAAGTADEIEILHEVETEGLIPGDDAADTEETTSEEK
ncbi:MAG: 30S ribosomal protein S2 [Bdellovibrionales bacterium]|nr:30S ribosomal protein S2 [Bdellovibrionales bacterium]